jgi:hypothetical protein
MKSFYLILTTIAIISSCHKKNGPTTNTTITSNSTPQVNYGPCGKVSNWKCIGGDSLFADLLTLTYFYTEKAQACDIYYYQQSYPLFNDFSYTFSVSGCVAFNDTITIKDVDTGKKSIFKRQN